MIFSSVEFFVFLGVVLLVLTIVLGLQTVGVVLMSAEVDSWGSPGSRSCCQRSSPLFLSYVPIVRIFLISINNFC